MTTQYRSRPMRLLEGMYPKSVQAAGIKCWSDVLRKFVKKGKFVRFKTGEINPHSLGNFNYFVAQKLYEEGHISKKEFALQRSLYSYRPRGFIFETLKKHDISSLGEAVSRCIDKKSGAFKPLGGKDKAPASNYEIAKILHHEGFLAENHFRMLERPEFGCRKLTDIELEGTENVSISMSKWPKEARDLINVFIIRRHNLSSDPYKYHSSRFKYRRVDLKFLATEFLRVPPRTDLPEFKTSGFHLHKIFGLQWVEEKLDDALSVVKNVLKEHSLLA